MGSPSSGLTGAVVAIYIAGEAVGALTQTVIGDKLGRIRYMQLNCIIVTIGTTIQTVSRLYHDPTTKMHLQHDTETRGEADLSLLLLQASVNLGMFLAGRAIAGIAVGGKEN